MKITLPTITNGQDLSTLNNNFALVATALNSNVLYRTNPVGEPNSLSQDLDFNGHAAYNLSDLTVNGVSISVTLGNAVTAASTSAAAALVSANNAATSSTSAGASASSASASAAAAAASAGAAGTLKVVNNLSDLASVATAKVNLALVKADVGLSNVDNTSDVNKPVSTAQATSIALKANTLSPIFTTSASVSAVGPTITLNDLSGTAQTNLQWLNGGVLTWSWFKNTDNSMQLGRYVGGAFQDSPIVIDVSTGIPAFANGLKFATGKGIIGGITATNITAGYVGEEQEVTGTATSITANAATQMVGLSLTAGEWDVQSTASFVIGGGATVSSTVVGISSTGSFGALGTYCQLIGSVITSPVVKVKLTATTNVFSLCQSSFTGGTVTVQGMIRARRVS